MTGPAALRPVTWTCLVLVAGGAAIWLLRTPGSPGAPGARADRPGLQRGARAEAPVASARAAAVDGAASPAPAASPVPRLASAELQLGHAARARRALEGTTGRERFERRAAAAAACRAVREHFPEARAEGAEAAFRAGELWRAGEELDLAREEFEAVLELDPGGPFAARAELELAHLERRRGNLERALAGYTRVLADASAAPRLRATAALRAGCAHRELGAGELARSLWEQVATSAPDPLDRVAGFDLLARDLTTAGDLEGAAGMLERARRELFEVARERTERGASVRAALAGMRALPELTDAVRRRRDGVRIDGRAATEVE